ncbi:hypothetical protein ZTR_09062 [Talaromyces verruculosus]|nr:hypothetical protein ZTR_09062 [Talaromyces verruculosus]
MTALVVGRVIAGVGGSGMYSGTLSFVAMLTSLKERPIYMAGSTVIWGIGSVLGLVVGRAAFGDSSATWRWAFYINLPIGAVFAPAYLFLIPSMDPKPHETFAEKCRMADWIMTTTFLAGSACMVMAIIFGSTLYAWRSGKEIALWIVGDPYHPHFLQQPILINLQVQMFLVSGIVLAMTYYIPLFFQFTRQGKRLTERKHVDTADLATSNAKIYGYCILVGAGSGCYIVAGFPVVQSLVALKDIPIAVGEMAISQDLGIVIFLAMVGSIYQNPALQKVSEAMPALSAADITKLIAGTSSQTYKALSESERALVTPEITEAIKQCVVVFLSSWDT